MVATSLAFHKFAHKVTDFLKHAHDATEPRLPHVGTKHTDGDTDEGDKPCVTHAMSLHVARGRTEERRIAIREHATVLADQPIASPAWCRGDADNG